MSLLDTTQLALDAAMRGSMLRQTLLTNNLANANTPGYQNQDVNFQSTLAGALQSGQSPSAVNFTPHSQSGSADASGNGVSTEQDSANLAENGLLYEDLTAVAAQREQILITAMGPAS
ncbi:MAG TPA: flagellar basal body protein [Solirubrobacteraceae bacterium]|jgi:flagellar basal-body rod protein FlgB|nr:flagellar basal body protein [Solirubrobacteraceae bacterium]